MNSPKDSGGLPMRRGSFFSFFFQPGCRGFQLPWLFPAPS